MKLNLWRKRVGAPKPGEKPLPVLFLVHGSSNSTRSSYDLSVPGKGEYSLMNVMAREGYDVWTMDHDGYGHSGRSGNNSDIASGVEDLKAAMPVSLKETGLQKMHIYGTSSGGIRAGGLRASAASSGRPADPVGLHLQGRRRGRNRAAAGAHRRIPRQPAQQARCGMIRSIFTRDGHPGAVDPAVPEAIIAVEMKFGDTIPTGTYLDMAAEPADRRSEEGALAGADAARHLGRQLDRRGPAGLLYATAERRPPVRHPAGDRAQPGLRQEPASACITRSRTSSPRRRRSRRRSR